MAASSPRVHRAALLVGAAAMSGAGGTTRPRPLQISSPQVQERRVAGIDVLLVRDDLCELAATGVRGNKARKLAAVPGDGPWVSYGGAQSNAAAAITTLAAHSGVPFTYYVRPVPKWLASSPVGNYATLLARGTDVRELRDPADYERLRRHAVGEGPRPDFVCPAAQLIPQGGAWPEAEVGVASLGEALDAHLRARALGGAAVVLPGGTGTTALFLARHVREAPVLVVPCVGGAESLQAQAAQLDRSAGALGIFPTVVEPADKVPFGGLSPTFLATWRSLLDSGIYVDLVYGACAWSTILARAAHSPLAGGVPLTYVHTGGLEGVPSQLARYRRAGMISDEEAAACLEKGRQLEAMG